jgi:hypothetical protein
VAACPACGKENPDGFQYCGFCTAPLTGDSREQRKTVTVLFCDVTGRPRSASRPIRRRCAAAKAQRQSKPRVCDSPDCPNQLVGRQCRWCENHARRSGKDRGRLLGVSGSESATCQRRTGGSGQALGRRIGGVLSD